MYINKRQSKELSIRKPEATSLSPSTNFNETNNHNFFNNLEDVHKHFGPMPPERIWNTHESEITTGQNPPRIVV
jgi:hypothetical protein